jgi:hypothetical protein
MNWFLILREKGKKGNFMKYKFLKATLAVAALGGSGMLSVANAAHISIPTGGFGVSNNFINNGVITTEYRADDTVWEWLDLTVTNGISYNSIVADLLNDGSLNNSGDVLFANDGAKQDVLDLTAAEASGWSTVSRGGVTSMFNAYFGFTNELTVDFLEYTVDAELVENFIALFGDTYHEGNIDVDNVRPDADPALPNIGYTYGHSDTAAPFTSVLAPIVYDGQFRGNKIDRDDYIINSISRSAWTMDNHIGSWLTREVSISDDSPQTSSVPEPSSITIFSLALLGLVSLRRKFAA